MAITVGQKLQGRQRRRARVRKKIFGTEIKPRLTVFRSAKHIYAQVIDDVSGRTLAAASTHDKNLRENLEGKKCDQATRVGEAVAQRCKEKSIEAVVFDRNGYRYHGRVKAVADGAREGGLRF